MSTYIPAQLKKVIHSEGFADKLQILGGESGKTNMLNITPAQYGQIAAILMQDEEVEISELVCCIQLTKPEWDTVIKIDYCELMAPVRSLVVRNSLEFFGRVGDKERMLYFKVKAQDAEHITAIKGGLRKALAGN